LQYKYVLAKFSELQEETIEMFQGMRDAGQPLFASSIRLRIKSLIQARQLQLLQQNSNKAFSVNLKWSHTFVNDN